ncbi:MAG TPA: SPOR domain-containing protein [Candidatus Binatus sp.]|nr:SPOR domain-containing protein [Candidatus Binatus sp.]
MAGSGKRGGGDRVLESRHLVGLFLGVVLLCGVFFTLGYVMGRNQLGGSVHAAESNIRNTPSSAKSKVAEPSTAPAPDWDFYDKNKDTTHLEPPTAGVKSPPASSAPAKPSAKASAPAASAAKPSVNDAKAAHLQQPAIPKSAIILQVAALRRQSDALEMAEAIQQKRFPCFVATPSSDNYYRVQVGPYQDIASAESAKRSLEQLGFKPIIKR